MLCCIKNTYTSDDMSLFFYETTHENIKKAPLRMGKGAHEVHYDYCSVLISSGKFRSRMRQR